MCLPAHDESASQVNRRSFSLLNQLHFRVKCLGKGLVNRAPHHFWIHKLEKRRYTRLQKLHFGKGHHIHGDLIQIHIQVSLKPHRACQVVNHVGNNRIFLLEILRLFLLIRCFQNRRPVFSLLCLHLLVLRVDGLDDVEQGLVVHGQHTVCVLDELIQR